jgi:hypothetical protein
LHGPRERRHALNGCAQLAFEFRSQCAQFDGLIR